MSDPYSALEDSLDKAWDLYYDEVDKNLVLRNQLDAFLEALIPKRASDWHEDYGPCIWWSIPIFGPPEYVGSPLDTDFPWSPEDESICFIPVPNPLADAPEV